MPTLFGTKLHQTTAYHPQANGLVERFHRHLKSALKAHLTGPNWIGEHSWVMLGIHTAPKEDLGTASTHSPCRLHPCSSNCLARSGSAPTAPSQPCWQPCQGSNLTARISKTNHCSHTSSGTVRIHPHGWAPPALQAPYIGPYKILDRYDKTFVVDLGGRLEHILVDRLKPAQVDLSAPVPLAQPPRQGRPPL